MKSSKAVDSHFVLAVPSKSSRCSLSPPFPTQHQCSCMHSAVRQVGTEGLYLRTLAQREASRGHTRDRWAAVLASPEDVLPCHGLHQTWSPSSLISLLLGVTHVQDSGICRCLWPSRPKSEFWGQKCKCLSEPAKGALIPHQSQAWDSMMNSLVNSPVCQGKGL